MRAVPRLGKLYPGICLTTEEKAQKTPCWRLSAYYCWNGDELPEGLKKQKKDFVWADPDWNVKGNA